MKNKKNRVIEVPLVELKIAEHFTSLQGESTYMGKPCFFIRLSGCNLNCSYCDTVFAKDASYGKDYTLEELLELAKKSGTSLVEITGGEPLLQPDVVKLMQMLLDSGFKVLLETNGSFSLANVPKDVVKILDCKTPSSGEANSMDFVTNDSTIKSGAKKERSLSPFPSDTVLKEGGVSNQKSINNFSILSKHDEIKFVISTRKDYLYAKKIIEDFNLNSIVDNILFSPVEQNNSTSSNSSFAANIAEWILEDKLDVRLQLQMHKILWDQNERER